MELELAEPPKSFEQLQVWKRACRLAVDIYPILSTIPDRSLRDQMNRAAVSIASNIAEGYERNRGRDFIRFLRIAKGSTGELRTPIYIAQAVGFISKENCDPLIQECKEIGSMLQGFIHSIKSRS